MKQLHFSYHAFDRVTERVKLNPSEVLQLLKNERYIDIGTEPKSNRQHRLFYSVSNRLPFVAIQDTKTNTIITILPIDYHNNKCWVISPSYLQMVKDLDKQNYWDTSSYEIGEVHVIDQSSTIPETNASKFRVSGVFADKYHNFHKCKNLGSWNLDDFNYCIDNLINSTKFLNEIYSKVQTVLRKEQEINSLISLNIKVGKHLTTINADSIRLTI